MSEIFVERNNYSLRENNILTRQTVKLVRYDTEIDSFLGDKEFWISWYFQKKNQKMDFRGMPSQTL